MMSRAWKLLLVHGALATLLLPTLGWAAEPPTTEQIEFFESRIRPVLVEQCYECHNTAEDAQGGLAVDHRQALLAGGEGGPVIVPGKPDKSRLLAILRHEIADMEMPQGGAKLDDRIIADFQQWIAMGAPDPRDHPPSSKEIEAATSWDTILEKRKQWWSFQPIRQPEVPEVELPAWSSHPIDHFVLAKLEEKQLQPVKRADAGTLVRRLFFTLIGLPPTPAEVQQWLPVLSQPEGFEQLVDHLLDRPQFGERWVRHWMDWIRYAETHGSEGDPAIVNAWHYRDYLIRALNDDVPYDQLVREHIAGDLLEPPRINEELGINESRIGPAHWRMVFHGFAPTDALEEKVRFTDDQINAFSKAFLGLTVSCARCHDHKFDAISQRDYYALFGILGSCRPGRVVVDIEERRNHNRTRLIELKPRIQAALAQDWIPASQSLAAELLKRGDLLEDANDPKSLLHTWWLVQQDVDAGMPFAAAWQRRLDAWRAETLLLTEHARRDYARRWNLGTKTDYARWFPTGTGLNDQPSVAGEFSVAPSGENALAGIYPSGVYSHGLSTKHAARLTSENVQLDGEYELWLRVIGAGGATTRYVVQNYPRSGTVYPVTALSAVWKWQKYDLAYWDGDSIHVELTSALDAPLLVKNNPRSWFGVREAVLVAKGQPGPPAEPHDELDPLFKIAAASPPTSFAELATCYAKALANSVEAWQGGTVTDAQAVFLGRCLEGGLLSNRLESLTISRPFITEYRRLEEEIVVPTRVPGLEETVARNQALFVRGNHKQPADEVPRRFLEAIDATPYDTPQSGRRQLADDMLREDNPFTRRVIVNRIWHHLFGQGIVATPDNFGSLGQTPSHPQLLDWLATSFAEQGWSLKRAIRQIITTNTWQLDSRPPPQARQIDPENRLLSHGTVRRLEAEAIRDALLQVSGDSSVEMFGQPVAGASNRRSIYVEVKRNALEPFLRVFDFPEPFSATGRRNVTNVPAQSLTMMNDHHVAAMAASWAARVLGDATHNSDAQRIQHMFQTAFGRGANTAEISEITTYLAETKRQYDRLIGHLASLQEQARQRRAAINRIAEPTRARLLEEAQANTAAPEQSIPRPIGLWEFNGDLADAVGAASGSAHGGARMENDALVVDGKQAHVLTAPLKQTLREKTLEVWVQLDNLEQRGGGVMTVQTLDGVVFDSIVFGEQSPRQWLAGSNNFRRTRPLNGDDERDAADRPVHIAMAYHADGRIVGYRDGRPYGAPYESNGPHVFTANEAIVSFGLRHLPATGNRMLSGRIFRAHLYDRALTDEEILATSRLSTHCVSDAQVLASLSQADRELIERDQEQIAKLTLEIKSLGAVPASFDDQALWTDLARALFSFKEFIYIK